MKPQQSVQEKKEESDDQKKYAFGIAEHYLASGEWTTVEELKAFYEACAEK